MERIRILTAEGREVGSVKHDSGNWVVEGTDELFRKSAERVFRDIGQGPVEMRTGFEEKSGGRLVPTYRTVNQGEPDYLKAVAQQLAEGTKFGGEPYKTVIEREEG